MPDPDGHSTEFSQPSADDVRTSTPEYPVLSCLPCEHWLEWPAYQFAEFCGAHFRATWGRYRG
jgi:hypothetical protein